MGEGLRKGPEILYRKMLLPHLRGTYADLLQVARSADFLMAGELVYAAPPVMVNAPGLIHFRKWGPLRIGWGSMSDG